MLSTLIVKNGKVFIGSRHKTAYIREWIEYKIHILDEHTGEERRQIWPWFVDFGDRVKGVPLPQTMIVTDKKIIVAAYKDKIYAFPESYQKKSQYAKNRLQIMWTAPIKGFYREPGRPIVEKGKLFIKNQYDELYALSTATGKILWEYRKNITFWTVSEEQILVMFQDPSGNSIVSLDKDTGKVQWNFRIDSAGDYNSILKINGGKVFVTSKKFLYELDSKSGKLLWKQKNNSISQLTAAEGKICVISGKDSRYKRIRCLDQATGSLSWECKVKDEYADSLRIIDNKLFVSGLGKLYVFRL